MTTNYFLEISSKLKKLKAVYLLYILILLCAEQVSSQYKTERPHNDFLNYGIKKLKPLRGLENEIIKSKVEVLGDVLKNHVDRLRKIPGQTVELVFLVDSSASVGAENFFNELKFVKKLLADFTVSYNQTRVAVVTFSSKSKVIRHIDHVTQASSENHKCSLLERELPHIRYSGGGTYTLGAMLEAQSVLAISRSDAVKAVFLVTDGYSNGGDPRPAAEFLKSRGVIIFTFGIQNGNVKELHDMASEPKEEHSYILNSFEEFEALARRALHEDLHSGMMIAQDSAACSTLCDERDNCCDDFARCTCGTHTGHYSCTCRLGYYGTGLKGDCKTCPPGTYRDIEGPSDITGCKPCPDPNMLGPEGATSPMQCFCNRGYTQNGMICERLQCPPLNPPANGHFVRESCERVVNAACGIRCRSGYQLNGSSIRLCREDGSWSGGDATCIVKTCPQLKPPKNGNMICSSETGTIDTQCHFTCKPGYQLVGSRMRTCLPVAMWDGIKVFCKPIFCTPLSAIKNGLIKPESCTVGKIKYGTRCEFGCDAGYQLSGPLKTTCIDQGIWSEGQQKARCVDVDPPVVQCPASVLTTTEPHENFANVEWSSPVVKDSSGSEVQLSTIPATKQPMKFKIGTHKVTYVAKDEWGNKAKCSFSITVKDDEPPTVDRCESPPIFLSREDEVDVYWEEPIFSDNSGGKVTVTRSREPGRFRQGETVVEYTAVDQFENRASCNMTISVQHHACEMPMDPINGVANCSENPDAVYCTLTCTDGYAFAMRPNQDYFCAYDGVWLPENNPLPFPECSVTSLSNTISQSGEIAMDDSGGSVCDDIFFMGQVENKLQKKLEETLSSVCAHDLLCEIATVEAVCEGLMAEIEEEFNSISYTRRRRQADEDSYFSQFWSVDDASSKWIYWRRGEAPESFGKRTKRSPNVFLSNNINSRKQFGFPSGMFDNVNGSSTVDKANENNANFMGVLTGLIVQSLGKDIGMTRFSSFLSSLGSKEGKYGINDFLAAFSKEFGEEKTKDLRILAEAKFGHILKDAESDAKLMEDLLSSTAANSNLSENISPISEEIIPTPEASRTPVMEKLMAVPNNIFGKLKQKFSPILFPGEIASSTEDPKPTKKGLKIKFQLEGQGEGAVEKLGAAMKNILKYAEEGLFDIDHGEQQIKVAAIRLSEDSTFICDPGSVLRDNLCVKCPVGTFFNVIAKDCQSCPEGSYQPEQGQVSCLVCPNNTSTKNAQAKSNNDCKAMCLPGSFSNDTLEPCTTCSLGEYQDEYASGECAACPFGTTTWRRGAWTQEECKPSCSMGEVSETGLKPCLPCPKNYFQSEEGKLECLKCPGTSYTNSSGSTSLYDCIGIAENSQAAYTSFDTLSINDCFSSPCLNDGFCRPLESGYVCECLLGYVGQQCETEVNECQNEPCLNNGTCEDLLGNFRCHCASGFNGNLCEQNIDDCVPQPCQNNASCVDLVDSFKCICESGYTGEICDINIDDCEMAPCSNGSSCLDGISDYTCVCPPGFSGRHCTTDIDECDSSPCIHGTCSDLVNDYICACVPGYSGKQCNVDIDDCISLPCTNNATCTDWLNGFSCNCLPGYTGKLCETKMSNDFVLEFPSSEIVNYASLENLPRAMSAVTVCFWMLTKDQENYGTPFSYATKTHDNALTLTDYSGFVLYVNGEKRITDVSANDGQWHMICVTWSSDEGAWSIHKDGLNVDSGIGLSTGKIIAADGVFVLGQEQDQRGGKYSIPESFIGEITLLNVWGGVLQDAYLYKYFSECNRYDGDIRSWPDFQAGIMGHIKLKSSTFCRGCGVPYPPKHGTIAEKSTESGSTVKVVCDEGYKIYLGDEERTCLVNGKWSGEEPTCKGVSCGFPGLLRNGDISGYSYDFGDELVFTCNKGFRLQGSVKRKCQADGKWSGEEAKCEVIKCPTPPPMDNGKLISNLGSYLPTNKVTFTCEKGFQMDGPATRSCGLDGNWDGQNSSCQPESCGTLPSIPHGVVSGSSGVIGGTVILTCDDGYQRRGKAEIICRDDGSWEHPLPKCVKETCDKPPPVTNGNAKIRVSTNGKEIKYTCDKGYVLDGPNNLLLCQEDGEWDHSYPTCIPQPCPSPDVPQFAKIHGDKKNWAVGDKVIYECVPGYLITVNSTMICTEGYEEGTWEGQAPVCAEIKCNAPLDVPGGSFTVIKGSSPGENFEQKASGEIDLLRLKRSPYEDFDFPTVGNSHNYEAEDFGQKIGADYDDFGQTQGGFGYAQSAENFISGNTQNNLEIGGGEDFGQTLDGLDVFSQSPDDGFDVFSQSPDDGFNFDYPQKPDDIIIENYPYNTTIKYVCNEGFKLLGDNMLRCSENGDWDHPEPRCYERHCPDFKSLEHGHVTYFGSGASSRVEFHCNDGYALLGEKEMICQPNRTWSAHIPICKQMKCANPVEPNNGTVSYTSVSFGAVVTYDCFPGFVLEGSFERHCGINGFWNGSMPRCVGIICNTPSVIDKGYIYYEGNLNVGSQVEYGCNECYNLVGATLRECQLDSTWSLDEPQCELIKCDNLPPELKNGRIIGDDNSCGSLVEYECDPGHEMIGKSKASCMENGKWTSAHPVCERMTCNAPPKLPNGKVHGSSFKFGDQVTYTCDKGYNINGNDVLTCDGSKKWSGNVPKCEIVFCKKPKGPSNGKVRVNGLFYGATIMIICDPGFRLEGEKKLQCQENGQWDKEMPFCAPIVCPAAPTPEYSYYNSTEVYFESFSYLKYTCETGYKTTVKNTILKCSATGNWTGDTIDCQPVDCGNPGILMNGIIEGDQFTFGNVIDFTCNEGFELIGEIKATCQENGAWSKLPTCQKIMCGSPKQINYGSIQASGIVGEYGSSVIYKCQNGYILKGTANRSCQKNRKWSGTLPVCNPVSCPEPAELINAEIEGEDYFFMKNITFTCHPGYIMKGQPILSCLETGEWSSEFPICEIISCSDPVNIANGKWETKKLSDIPLKAQSMTDSGRKKKGHHKTKTGHGGKSKLSKNSKLTSLLNEQLENILYRAGHLIEYTCDDGYFKSTSSILECTDKGWNSPPPVCRPVSCPLPVPVRNGRVLGSEVTFGSTLSYECNEGYEIMGASSRTCQANKEWTGADPQCRHKECPLPAQIHNGKTHYDSLKYQAIITYSCSPGFRLEGETTRVCQSDERWSGHRPVCVEIFCDEPEEVFYAVRDIGHLKVGGSVRYSCMEGYRLEGKSSLNCQSDGKWDRVAPICVQVDCGPPPTGAHLILSGDSTIYASKVKYSCERGFKIEGDYWTSCLQSGLWSNTPPNCNLVTCDLPITPEHGILLEDEGTSNEHLLIAEDEVQTADVQNSNQISSGEKTGRKSKVMKYSLETPQTIYHVDDAITYSCAPGWEAVGEVRLACTQDGTWSAQPPNCQKVSCGPPKIPSFAKLTGENYLFSDLITFSCQPGYVMRGNPSMYCGESGKWTDHYPACEPLSCGPPTVLPHSRVTFQTPEHGLDHHFGSVVTYFCDYGYQLEGSLYLTCDSSSKWVGPREAPKCVEMSCDKPPVVVHATGVEETGVKPQRVNYQCDPGYILAGVGNIECSLGKWSAINFTCNPVNCFKPVRPTNGIFTAKHFMLGSIANYSCVQGYILEGNPSVECSVDGLWLGDIPVCQPVNCGVPESPLNGGVTFNSTLFASSASYYCGEGHELKGDVSRLCSSDGNWSGHLPQCHRVNCGELRPPYRGYVIGVGQLYMDEVKFTCDKGYVLQGNETLVCRSDGTWSESGQRCESVRCIPPGFILNGQPPIDLTKDYVYGDRISYSCDDGYIPRGDMSSTCQKGGTWSQVKGQCSLISCGRPKLNKDGAVILGRSFYYKDKVRLSCPSGTKPKGSTLLTCLSDGSWSGDAACISSCSITCLNGGVCLNENTCSCPAGYTGKRCQHANCNLPCLNGGTCVAPYKCQCAEGFQGTRCQRPLCPLPCLNGGVCTGPHKCTCLPGYAGTRCQTPVCEHSCGFYGKCIGPNVCLCKYGETGATCPEYDDYEEETQEHPTHFRDWDIAGFRRMKSRMDQ